MWRKKRGVKLFQQINGLKVMVKTSERKQFSGTPCISLPWPSVLHKIDNFRRQPQKWTQLQKWRLPQKLRWLHHTCYLLVVIYQVLPVTCYLFLATCYLLPVTCYLPPVTCYLLLAICYLLLADTCNLILSIWSSVIWSLLFLAKELLPFAPVVRLALVFWTLPLDTLDFQHVWFLYYISKSRVRRCWTQNVGALIQKHSL